MTDNNGQPPFSTEEIAQGQVLWAKCRTFLSTVLTESDMRNWIDRIEARGYRDGEFVLYAPSEAFVMYLEEHYMEQFNTMQQIYMRASGARLVFEYETAPTPKAESLQSEASASKRERSIEHYTNNLNESHSFDTFLMSPCNRMARMVAEAVAINPGQSPYNVLFIHGPSGVGKTHLSQALGLRVRMLHPELRVCYVSCAKFEAQYSQDARFHEKSAFFDFYQQMDVLIIDDIQGLVGKEKTQDAFFEIFNHLYLLNKQIVLTCDVPPVEFEGIQNRILTRIQSSMMLALERPDLELRRKILQQRMAEAGVSLGEEVVDYIAHNMQNNVRELEGAMKTLLTYAHIQGQAIDIDLATSVISRSVNMNRVAPTLEHIARVVAEAFDIEVEDLRSASRAKKFAQPRQIVMYLSKKHTDQTQEAIALKLRRKNHTTVIHGVKAIANLMEQDSTFRASVECLEQKIWARS